MISALLVMIFMGIGLACETPPPPEPPVAPVPNNTCNQSVDVDNTVDVDVTNNNTNTNTNINNNNQSQSQNQNQDQDQQQTQNQTVNVQNTFNPVNNYNPVVSIQLANNQLLMMQVDQSQVSQNWPTILCVGAITPYGKIVSIGTPTTQTESNATNIPMQSTGFPLGALISGIGLAGLGIVAASKSGLMARLGL